MPGHYPGRHLRLAFKPGGMAGFWDLRGLRRSGALAAEAQAGSCRAWADADKRPPPIRNHRATDVSNPCRGNADGGQHRHLESKAPSILKKASSIADLSISDTDDTPKGKDRHGRHNSE